jgi:hypothetical protein
VGSTNYGDQIKTFDYLQEGTSEGFNKLLHDVIPTGIISGGLLGKTSDVLITISPMICYISDPTRKVSVRVETTAIANISVSAVTPFLVCRMDWINIENNYMDILALAEDEIESSDLIIGRCIYAGATLGTVFDYSWKNEHPFINLVSSSEALKVSATDPYTVTVNISSGILYFNSKKVVYAGGVSPSFTTTGTDGRIDLLCINDSGVISITEGTASSAPVIPTFPNDKLVLAIITIPASKLLIEGSFIENIYYDRYVDNYAKALSDLTTHAGLTNPHSATSLATADRLVLRDSSGRARIADPDDNADIANKGYVISQASAYFKQYGLGVSTDPGEAIVTNANTAFTQGSFRLAAAATGNPFGHDSNLSIKRNGAGQIEQECVDLTLLITDLNRTMKRVYSGSAWSSWVSDISQSDLTSYISNYLKYGISPYVADRQYKGGFTAVLNTAWDSSFTTASQAANLQIAPGYVLGHWNSTATLYLYKFTGDATLEAAVGSGYVMGTNGANYCVPFAPTWNGSDECRCLLLDVADNYIRELKIVLSTGAITAENSVSFAMDGSYQGAANLYRYNQNVTNNVTFAHIDAANGLRAMLWDGATVTQVGNAYTSYGTLNSQIDMDFLKDGYVCINIRISSNARLVKVMKFDGTDWSEIYSNQLTANASSGALKCITDTDFVAIDDTNEVAYLFSLTLDDSVSAKASMGAATSLSGDDAIVIRPFHGVALMSDRAGYCAYIFPAVDKTYSGWTGDSGTVKYRGIYHDDYKLG